MNLRFLGHPSSIPARYAVSALLVAIVFAAHSSLHGLVAERPVLTFFLIATFLATWVGRAGAGAFALIIGYILADYFFLEPLHSLSLVGFDDYVGLVVYLSAGILGIAAIENLHRFREKSQRFELLSRTAAGFLAHHDPAATFETLLPALKEGMTIDVCLIFLANYNGTKLQLHAQTGTAPERDRTTDLELGEGIPGTAALTQQPVVLNYIRRSENPLAALLKKEGIRCYACFPVFSKDRLIGTLSFGSRKKARFGKIDIDFLMVLSQYVGIGLDRFRLWEQIQAHASMLEQRVTERTASLRESIKSLEGVLYHVAHDLRAPLRTMHSFTEVLLDKYAPNLGAQGQRYAQGVCDASVRMDQLIHDLLDFGRCGQQQVEWTTINLSHAIAKVLTCLRPSIESKGAQIRIDNPLPPVRADAQLLEQVLVQLLDNALKFVPPETTPEVRIWAERQNGTVRLNIEDNGIGIAPEHHHIIFGIFQRLQYGSEQHGTGIGLAIVRKAMDRMNAGIGLHSTPGRGSCFWLDFSSATAT